jgi:protein-L-isoaspartate(D-aspartate) O-methyltransferase
MTTLEQYRHFYADEIRIVADLRSSDLVRAFAVVPREKYLGPPPWKICSGERTALASDGAGGDGYITTSNPCDLYHNVLVAIDTVRHLNNGHPSSLAHWIADLDLKSGSRVYHAGCGVGYYTAILAELVGPQGSVVAIEIDPDLAARSAQNLSGYPWATVHAGDGAAFDPGMCDAMLINAGVTHPHRLWLDRLKEGGCIILPLTANTGGYHGNGVMVKITRQQPGFSARVVSAVSIYSFTSVRDPDIEPLLGNALARRDLLKMKSLILHKHTQTGTCLLHTPRMCLSSSIPGA